jgi:carboxyl-terminal processing protease
LVYGGGGIVPDIFVPLDTVKFSAAVNKLYNSGTLNSFAFEYTDRHRSQFIKDYKNASQFIANFSVQDKELNTLRNYLHSKKINSDLKANDSGFSILLKALIGRNLFDKDAYYPILYQNDLAILKALEVLK